MTLNRWTKHEDDFLKNNYGIISVVNISLELNRSYAAVRNRVASLKLKSPKLWTKEENNFIKNNAYSMSDQEMAIILGCSYNCLRHRRVILGLKRENFRVSPGARTLNQLENAYRQSSKRKGNWFELTTEQFRNIICQNCHYCNAAPIDKNCYYNKNKERIHTNVCSEVAESQWVKANGIDRKNNLIGYTIENCVPCCFTCNDMKKTMSYEQFIEHISNIVKVQKERNEK